MTQMLEIRFTQKPRRERLLPPQRCGFRFPSRHYQRLRGFGGSTQCSEIEIIDHNLTDKTITILPSDESIYVDAICTWTKIA